MSETLRAIDYSGHVADAGPNPYAVLLTAVENMATAAYAVLEAFRDLGQTEPRVAAVLDAAGIEPARPA